MAVTVEEFTRMNLMAGTARSLEQKDLSVDDRMVWDRDFDLLVAELRDIVDPELAADLSKKKDFYTAACQVAKGYFNDKPFGGLKSATGQFGFRFIIPQDMRNASGGGTGNQWYSWKQTKSTGAATTAFDWLFSSASPLLAETEAEHKTVIALHRLISYKPSPRLVMVQFKVNDYEYAPYAVEVFSQIEKPDKLYKLIPMPGNIILHPGGKLYVKLWVDPLLSGTTAPAVATTIDLELALFGLIFAEHSYLNIDDAIV